MDSSQSSTLAPPPPTGSLFGGMGMGGMGGASQLSPYLNVDPSYLNSSSPEFIFNQVNLIGKAKTL